MNNTNRSDENVYSSLSRSDDHRNDNELDEPTSSNIEQKIDTVSNYIKIVLYIFY